MNSKVEQIKKSDCEEQLENVWKKVPKRGKGNKIMKELNIANNSLSTNASNHSDMSGVIAIADAIPTIGALVTVNVMGNKIGNEQLSKLQEMMQAHPTLVSLCGIANDATEANLSGLKMDADDAVILAAELPAKGAITSLNISNNNLTNYGGDMSGVEALAAAIPECK